MASSAARAHVRTEKGRDATPKFAGRPVSTTRVQPLNKFAATTSTKLSGSGQSTKTTGSPRGGQSRWRLAP